MTMTAVLPLPDRLVRLNVYSGGILSGSLLEGLFWRWGLLGNRGFFCLG